MMIYPIMDISCHVTCHVVLLDSHFHSRKDIHVYVSVLSKLDKIDVLNLHAIAVVVSHYNVIQHFACKKVKCLSSTNCSYCSLFILLSSLHY